MKGPNIGGIKGDTRSLDFRLHGILGPQMYEGKPTLPIDPTHPKGLEHCLIQEYCSAVLMNVY